MVEEAREKPPSSPLVFISHDSRDAELAAHFKNLLFNVSSGLLKSFCSSNKKMKQGVPYGSEWYRSIMKALCSASDVVCLLTERSLERPWILYEAGFPKGRSDVPIVGIALGIPLSRASAGPFSQFQNCDDDVESLIQLVMQLTERIPGMKPELGIVKRQVEAFKNKIVLKKLLGAGGPEKEDESPETKLKQSISGLSIVALNILDLYYQLDETSLYTKRDIIPNLNEFSKIQIESGLDELEAATMIGRMGPSPESGVMCYLTQQGKMYLAQKKSN